MADDSGHEDTDAASADRSWWQAFGHALLRDDLDDGGAADEIRKELGSLRTMIERISSDWFLAGPGREIDRRLARIEQRLDELAGSGDQPSR